jgi:hypothetical protein
VITSEALANMIRRVRPHAKFISVSHSSSFIDPAGNLGEGFYFASLYDEAINANLTKGDFGFVLIENSYIVSFAYNLFFCLLYCHRRREPGLLNRLLVHNLKKFCAEQLYRQRNVVSARALLLETPFGQNTQAAAA